MISPELFNKEPEDTTRVETKINGKVVRVENQSRKDAGKVINASEKREEEEANKKFAELPKDMQTKLEQDAAKSANEAAAKRRDPRAGGRTALASDYNDEAMTEVSEKRTDAFIKAHINASLGGREKALADAKGTIKNVYKEGVPHFRAMESMNVCLTPGCNSMFPADVDHNKVSEFLAKPKGEQKRLQKAGLTPGQTGPQSDVVCPGCLTQGKDVSATRTGEGPETPEKKTRNRQRKQGSVRDLRNQRRMGEGAA
jgi:hypothetical protein